MEQLVVSDKQWRAIHKLAAELAQRQVDDNLVSSAAAFMKAYPEADFLDWLYRLNQLGEIFKYSEQTERHRHELWGACQRLNPQPTSGREWALLLSWVARLQKHYETDSQLARQVSDASRVTLPPKPKPYKIPAALQQTKPDIPQVREEPSEKAVDLFAQMQALWNKREEE